MEYNPLIKAVRDHNLFLCRKLLLDGEDVNEQITLGTTALHMACLLPAEEGIMELLLQNNADPKLENIQGLTPLMQACRNHSFSNAALLLKYGAKIDHMHPRGNTALLNAVLHSNSSSAVKFLCANGANPNVVNANGDTSLHIACSRGDVRMASILLEHGANANYVSTDGQNSTPILLSIVSGSPPLMSMLLVHGADVLHENSSAESALFLSCRLNRATQVLLLCTELFGLDINMHQNDERGYTALMVAAQHNSLDAARVLLEHHCDMWVKSKATLTEYPVTAYDVALMHGHQALANLIDSFLNPPTERLY